jgi:plastocyanin
VNVPAIGNVKLNWPSGAITPNPISVPVGSTVTWMNKDSSAHSVVADGGAFNSGTIAPDGQFSFTFPIAGTFTYHDASNASMSGTVNVTPSAACRPHSG